MGLTVYNRDITAFYTASNVVVVLLGFVAIKGMKLLEKYQNCADERELMEICEKLGDLSSCSEVKQPVQALKFYSEQVHDLRYCRTRFLPW